MADSEEENEGQVDLPRKGEVKDGVGVRPKGNRLVLKKIEEDKTTESGIVIPESAGREKKRGEVVGRGPGKPSIHGDIFPPEAELGDVVFFDERQIEMTITVGGEEYLVIEDNNVPAVEC